MTKKGNKIKDDRIQGICKDLKRIRTYEGLKKFLISELEMTQECIDERNDTWTVISVKEYRR